MVVWSTVRASAPPDDGRIYTPSFYMYMFYNMCNLKGVPPISSQTQMLFGMFRNGSEHAKSTAINTHDVLTAVMLLRKLEQMLI